MSLRRWLLPAALPFAAACGDGPTDPPPAGDGIRLVIAPGALLLAEPGTTGQLRAYAIDADGDSTLVEATFQTSDPAVVSIAGDVATGAASLGSAQITATSGELTSAPILALRATPAAGALLVADSQVVGMISAVDPAAAYGIGWQYRVRLRGVSPAAGQIVLATGGAPVGGRVVSAAAAGTDTEVVLSLIGIDDMFAELELDERLPLANAELAASDLLRGGFGVRRTPAGGVQLTPRRGSGSFRASRGAAPAGAGGAAIEQEFELGPFDCKAEVPPAFTFPLTLDVFSMELNQTLNLDLVIAGASLQRFVIDGGIAPRITANPRLTAALEAKAECKVHVATLILPIGGPLALIIGGQVPLGVGFEVGAKASFGELGIDAFLESSIAAEFGIDCAAGCQVVADIGGTAPTGFFKPVLPSLGTDTRFELSASAFGWGELTIGNRFLEALQFKTVEMKAGLEQKFELAAPEVQAADPAYASSYALKPAIEAKAAANLTPIADLLRINLATLTFAPELPTISQSARGTFAITPASVAPGDGTQLGDMATFTVNLTDVTYFGAYAVEAVQIRWRRTVGETTVLESGRPGCTDLAAAQDQITFTCETDFLDEHAGEQTFHAFVLTRVFGVPVPVPLELAADAKATVTVTDQSALKWTFDTDNEGWGEGGDGTVFHLEREGGVLKLHGTDDAVGTPNAWIFKQIDLPADVATVAFRVSAHDRDGATVAWRVRLVDASGTSHTLLDWEVLSGAEGVHLWADRSASIAAWAGTTVTMYVEQDDDGQHNHEHFYISEIVIDE